MPQNRTDRTSYLGLLAIMGQVISTAPGADSKNWSFPYWNQMLIDACLEALAIGPRDGVVHVVAPATAPTVVVGASGQIPGSVTLDVVQTFVDAYGRETGPSPVATVSTPEGIVDPDTAPTLGTPSLGGASGFEGGLLEVWYTWTDGAGGETLPSPSATVEVPYQSGGLKSEVVVTLPSTAEDADAVGANVYIQHRGGNIVLAYRIEVDDVDEITLTGAVADCYRSTPVVNSTGSTGSLAITGVAAPDAAAVAVRFYIRETEGEWAAADRRLILAGLDEWDPATVTYPLVYTGALAEIAPGFPPTISQVKALSPIDLASEVTGILALEHLPPVGDAHWRAPVASASVLPAEDNETGDCRVALAEGTIYEWDGDSWAAIGADTSSLVSEADLVVSTGECVLSGLTVAAHAPEDMGVRVVAGAAIQAGGRRSVAQVDLTIPAADASHDRLDIVVLAADGTVDGPTENVALKGTPAEVPVAPAVPTGAMLLATISVPASQTSIQAGWVNNTSASRTVTLRAHEADATKHLPAWIDVAQMIDGPSLVMFFGPCVLSMGDPSAMYTVPVDPEAMQVTVPAGLSLTEYGIFSHAEATLDIPTADETNPRYDLVIVTWDAELGRTVVMGPTEDAALKGTPAASPEVPALPEGAMLLATITVAADATEILAEDIDAITGVSRLGLLGHLYTGQTITAVATDMSSDSFADELKTKVNQLLAAVQQAGIVG